MLYVPRHLPNRLEYKVLSVCLLLQDLLQSCSRGGSGTREEPGTLTQGAPDFPGSSRLGSCVN